MCIHLCDLCIDLVLLKCILSCSLLATTMAWESDDLWLLAAAFFAGWMFGRMQDVLLGCFTTWMARATRLLGPQRKLYRVSIRPFAQEVAREALPDWGLGQCANCDFHGTHFAHAAAWHIWSVRNTTIDLGVERCCSATRSALGACQRMMRSEEKAHFTVIHLVNTEAAIDMNSFVSQPCFHGWCIECFRCTGFSPNHAAAVAKDVKEWATSLEEVILDRTLLGHPQHVVSREVHGFNPLQKLAIHCESEFWLRWLL